MYRTKFCMNNRRCFLSLGPIRGDSSKEAHNLALPDYSQVRRASDSSCNVNTFKERTKLENIYKNAINANKPSIKNSKTSTTNLSQLHKELVGHTHLSPITLKGCKFLLR